MHNHCTDCFEEFAIHCISGVNPWKSCIMYPKTVTILPSMWNVFTKFYKVVFVSDFFLSLWGTRTICHSHHCVHGFCGLDKSLSFLRRTLLLDREHKSRWRNKSRNIWGLSTRWCLRNQVCLQTKFKHSIVKYEMSFCVVENCIMSNFKGKL